MAITTDVDPSLDPGIDGLLGDTKWSIATLSFSFPDNTLDYEGDYYEGIPFDNFAQFNPAQQASVRTILAEVSAYTPLAFTEQTTPDGSAILRFGRTDARQTASAFLPHEAPEGGDVWVNNSRTIYDAPSRGNYAYATLLHEIGHALGLKHGHESPALPAAVDSLEFTVMTYRSYVGASTTGGYTNGAFGYPQTFMLLDIAALQYLYGADFGTNGGNNVYRWDPATGAFSIDGAVQWTPGANRVFMTVWDGDGVDSYDFGAWTTGVQVSLVPGSYSVTSAAQKADLGNGNFARGNVWNAYQYQGDARSLIENAIGGSGNDSLTGNDAANRLEGGGGDDILSGGLAGDTMIGGFGSDIYFVGEISDIVVELTGGGTDEVRTAIGDKSVAGIYVLPDFVENFLGTSAAAQGAELNALDNVAVMGSGNDLLVMHDGGVDSVDGGAGNDFFYWGATFTAADSAVGGAGTDTVGLLGNYAITLSAGNLIGIERFAMYSAGGAPGAIPNHYNITTINVNVAAGASLVVIALSLRAGETLTFNGAAETDGSFNIRGGKGNDLLVAGSGNDQLFGNVGADTLSGGAGNDLFDYYAVAESTSVSRDGIQDFALGDRINLFLIDADGNAANGNGSFNFIGASAFHNVAGELRAAQVDGSIWLVQADVDGDGIPDLEINVIVTDGHQLTSADFVI